MECRYDFMVRLRWERNGISVSLNRRVYFGWTNNVVLIRRN